MKHYYITDLNAEKGFVEVTESEFISLIGTEETRPYASKVYRGELSIEEVPEDLQAAVQSVVDSKIRRWGEYSKQELSDSEIGKAIREVFTLKRNELTKFISFIKTFVK